MKDINRLLILTEAPETYETLAQELGFHDLQVVACHTAEEAGVHVTDCEMIFGEPGRISDRFNTWLILKGDIDLFQECLPTVALYRVASPAIR
ncbi:MAG: hypothetical protein R6X27_11140 [Candidatus Desulfacyla sp.]